jgi:hypothetical protein
VKIRIDSNAAGIAQKVTIYTVDTGTPERVYLQEKAYKELNNSN